MKRIAVLLLVFVLLSGCAAQRKTLYSCEYFTATREGRIIRITDAQTGAEYDFITRRVKRGQSSAKLETAEETETMTIRTAYNIITVTVNGETYLIRI